MARIFIHHDKEGKVLGVVAVDALPEGCEHPFQLTNEEHGVVDLAVDDPAHGGDLLELLERRIDVKATQAPAAPNTEDSGASPQSAPPKKRGRKP